MCWRLLTVYNVAAPVIWTIGPSDQLQDTLTTHSQIFGVVLLEHGRCCRADNHIRVRFIHIGQATQHFQVYILFLQSYRLRSI